VSLVILGEFVFTKSEVPDYIPFGGEQALKVHQYVGGNRTTDAMGVIEPDISWSGIFMGGEMYSKARYLDQLMRAANPLVFTYAQARYVVLIKNFDPQYRDTYIEYSITLSVIKNLTQPVVFLPQLTWIDAVEEELANAQLLADLIKNGDISDKIGALASAINQVPDLGSASQSVLSNIASLIGDANSAVSSAIDGITGGLF